jgi:hypothetical protein
MPDDGLITQAGADTRVDVGAIPPPAQEPQLNDFQKAFNQHFEGNELMKRFSASENPFAAVAEELAKAPAATTNEGFKPLTDQSTPEEIAAFRKALGAFEKADDYKYEPPTSDDEAIKKLLPADAPFVKAFQEIALKNHMPESTWNEIMSAYNQMMIEDAKTAAELSAKALEGVKENWVKTHGESAPKVEGVFQKYFAHATPAETSILATLSADQLAAIGSVVFRQEKKLGSEDSIDATNLGTSTMSDVEYVSERSKLLSRQRELTQQGKAWGPEAEEVKHKLQELSARYKKA